MNSADFRSIADLVREHAQARPAQPALLQEESTLSWGELDTLMDRIAAALHALQRDHVLPGQAIALAGTPTPLQAALFLRALRAGIAVAPLAPSVIAHDFASMLDDAQATASVVTTSLGRTKMKAFLSIFGRLLRLMGMLLKGTGDRTSRVDVAGHPDVAKLRSTHVDPYRTGNYFACASRASALTSDTRSSSVPYCGTSWRYIADMAFEKCVRT